MSSSPETGRSGSNHYFVNGKFYSATELQELYSSQSRFFDSMDKKYQGNEKYSSLSNTQKLELALYDVYQQWALLHTIPSTKCSNTATLCLGPCRGLFSYTGNIDMTGAERPCASYPKQ